MANWFSRLFERKDSQFGALTVRMLGMGRAAWPARNAEHLAREGYVRNIIGYRCIRLVAESAASIPTAAYLGDKQLDTHDLVTLLANPNPTMDGRLLLEGFYSWLQISGNGYLEQVTGLGKKPVELWLLRSDRMKVVPGPNAVPSAYDYTVNGQTKRVDVNYDLRGRDMPILHMRTFNPLDDWYGLSQLDPAAWSVDMHSGASQFDKSLLDNSAVPSGALRVVPDKEGRATLDAVTRQNLLTDLESRFQGAKNAGRPLVLEGGLEWQKISMTLQEMQLIETKREAAREICHAFGVPPMLLGIPGDNTYSNYQEARLAFFHETVIPLATRGTGAISNWLAPSFEKGLSLRPNTGELDALAPERQKQWERISESQFLTVNEKRGLLGYKTVPEGDIIVIPAKATSVEMLATGVANDKDKTSKPHKEDED